MLVSPQQRLLFVEVRGTKPDPWETSCYPFEIGAVMTDNAGELFVGAEYKALICFDALGKKLADGEWPKDMAEYVAQYERAAASVYTVGAAARDVARALLDLSTMGALERGVDPDLPALVVSTNGLYAGNMMAKIFQVAGMELPFGRVVDTYLLQRAVNMELDFPTSFFPEAIDVAQALASEYRDKFGLGRTTN